MEKISEMNSDAAHNLKYNNKSKPKEKDINTINY